MVKLAVVAVLSTMLVRFPWFRRIPAHREARLARAAGLRRQPRRAAHGRRVARLLLGLRGSRPDALGIVPGRPPGRTLRRRHRRRDGRASRRLIAGEWIALPFAIGCGFAGGGLREICPKEAIWHFSPLFFTDLHRYVWRLVRRFRSTGW